MTLASEIQRVIVNPYILEARYHKAPLIVTSQVEPQRCLFTALVGIGE
jgi:hypothetical protein